LRLSLIIPRGDSLARLAGFETTRPAPYFKNFGQCHRDTLNDPHNSQDQPMIWVKETCVKMARSSARITQGLEFRVKKESHESRGREDLLPSAGWRGGITRPADDGEVRLSTPTRL
jgi:hypothetical protein